MVPASQEFSRIDNWCRSASRINVADRLGRSSPFLCVGSRLGCDNEKDVGPYEVCVNSVEKIFEHDRVFIVPVLGVSLPLCKPGLG